MELIRPYPVVPHRVKRSPRIVAAASLEDGWAALGIYRHADGGSIVRAQAGEHMFGAERLYGCQGGPSYYESRRIWSRRDARSIYDALITCGMPYVAPTELAAHHAVTDPKRWWPGPNSARPHRRCTLADHRDQRPPPQP